MAGASPGSFSILGVITLPLPLNVFTSFFGVTCQLTELSHGILCSTATASMAVFCTSLC